MLGYSLLSIGNAGGLMMALYKKSMGGYAKHRLSKFKGISKENFLLHLKECEFIYNTKTTQENLYHKLLKLIRENPIKFH